MNTPLVALATENPAVRDVIHATLSEYFRLKGTSRRIDIAATPREYVPSDGFANIMEEARKSAEAVRNEKGALLGIAGGYGPVTLMVDRKHILCWETFVLVATAEDGLVAATMPQGTYPRAHEERLTEIIKSMLWGYGAGKPEISEEMSEMAGVAVSGWSQLSFQVPPPHVIWTQ